MAYRYWQQAVPFDGDFDATSDRELYCTEMIWAAYREVGVDLVERDFVELSTAIRKGSFIMPSTLTGSRSLRLLRGVPSESFGAIGLRVQKRK